MILNNKQFIYTFVPSVAQMVRYNSTSTVALILL